VEIGPEALLLPFTDLLLPDPGIVVAQNQEDPGRIGAESIADSSKSGSEHISEKFACGSVTLKGQEISAQEDDIRHLRDHHILQLLIPIIPPVEVGNEDAP